MVRIRAYLFVTGQSRRSWSAISPSHAAELPEPGPYCSENIWFGWRGSDAHQVGVWSLEGELNIFRRTKNIFPLLPILTALALPAQAEEPNGPGAQGHPAVHPGPAPARPGPTPGRGPQDAHLARRALPSHDFGGHAYHGRFAWEGGRWHHEVRNGRDGWWWDVGGAWYYYPQPMEGPPAYVSDVEIVDEGPAVGGYPPPQGYAPPPVAYAPPPPPPPPPADPAASAVGGAIVGGLLGGLLTGRAGGAAAGAIVGGTTGAIVGAQAAQRPGYFLSQGGCYYRYPSGQYVQVDPRSCE